MRNHSAHRSLNQQFRMPNPSCADVFRFMATDVTGKAHESFLLFLFAGDANFFGINHDHEIAGIDVRGEDTFFLPPQKIRRLDRDAAKDLIFRVNDPPFAWDVGCFSGEGFHQGREKARKLRARAGSVNFGAGRIDVAVPAPPREMAPRVLSRNYNASPRPFTHRLFALCPVFVCCRPKLVSRNSGFCHSRGNHVRNEPGPIKSSALCDAPRTKAPELFRWGLFVAGQCSFAHTRRRSRSR